MRIGILITNPNHHVGMTLGVAKLAKSEGHEVEYISLCELRRMPTPVERFKKEGVACKKFAELPKNLKPSSGKQTLGSSDSKVRALVRYAFWRLKLKPFISKTLKGYDNVLLLNDAAFPGDRICGWLKSKQIPFTLLQEGIRFPLPGESEVKYGGNGARSVMVWGQRSAQHFAKVIAPTTQVVVTGSPRFDEFLAYFAQAGQAAETQKTLGLFTNPIDDQGFCSKSRKIEMVKDFLANQGAYLNQQKVRLIIKSHPREDVQEYYSIATQYVDDVQIGPSDIKECINLVQAGVIMASTVGLELLGAGKALAQMEIPGHGYVFDYTDHPGLVKVPLEREVDLSSLFAQKPDFSYFEEHIKKGNAVKLIYEGLVA